MRWPPRSPQSYARLSSTKTIRRSHLPYQPTIWAGPLHQSPTAPLPWTKLPPRLLHPKALYQHPSGLENTIKTTHNQRMVLAWNLNLPPIVTVMSHQWPVLAQATSNLITPGRSTTRLQYRTTARNSRNKSNKSSRCTRTSVKS